MTHSSVGSGRVWSQRGRLWRAVLAIIAASALLVSCADPVSHENIVEHGDGVPAQSESVVSWAAALVPDGYAPGEGADSYTNPSAALGAASATSTDVVVLGRGGMIELDMGGVVSDGPGADFAVWENGIVSGDLLFVELAYVEVSSNGVDYARFPVSSRRTEAVGTGTPVDPGDYSGFAGVHPVGTGTAFDLGELASEETVLSGAVDLSAVRYIRIVDVIGDGCERDDSEPPRPIYDPYPTVGTAGFDLNAIGVVSNS